ncbi:MAG: hypothetical protein DWQ34_22355 [Planctomycetota bacterium]|nr:MAG: hypothetical protein DWQ34_22355 [Planctomycetota bacterium]REK26064.1 MAG: hypothetical protein DWQ41_10425 [Planctomycetota bacterium]
MGEQIPALIFGLLLAAGGVAGLIWHIRAWRSHREDEQLSGEELRYYRRQFFRRIQTTGLIAVIGVMLPIGANLDIQANPGWSIVIWMIILGLALWVMVLGFGDLFSTRLHARDAISRLKALKQEQRSLEREVARLRAEATGDDGTKRKPE